MPSGLSECPEHVLGEIQLPTLPHPNHRDQTHMSGHSPKPALLFPPPLSEQSRPQEAMKRGSGSTETMIGFSGWWVPAPRPPGLCAALGGLNGAENLVNAQEKEGTHPPAHTTTSIRCSPSGPVVSLQRLVLTKPQEKKQAHGYGRPRETVSLPHSPGVRPGWAVSVCE